jgi:DNA-binding NtrC family response regulator
MSATVLIVERSPALTIEWRHLFGALRVVVLDRPSQEEAADAIRRQECGIVVVQCVEDVLIWARRMRSLSGNLPIIVYTATSSEDRAIAALRAGVNDYVRQSRPDELVRSVLRWTAPAAAPPEQSLPHGRPVIGDSRFACDLRARIAKAATNDSNVLITGETGTGKDLVAELIHENSSRRQEPMVCVNCAAIPESLVESELFGHERGAFTGADAAREGKLKCAEGGTLFLDEIGDMNLPAQAKILRVIESREYQRLGSSRSVRFNTRVITATNQNVERFVEEGKFRRDLYFRLNVVRIHLAPLREHPEDIPPLMDHFVRLLNLSFGQSVQSFTDEVRDRFMQYSWPGNIRELRNVVEGVFADGPPTVIGYGDISPAFRAHLENGLESAVPERSRMIAALQATRWNVTQAAQKMNWSRMTFYRKMAKHQIASGQS